MDTVVNQAFRLETTLLRLTTRRCVLSARFLYSESDLQWSEKSFCSDYVL